MVGLYAKTMVVMDMRLQSTNQHALVAWATEHEPLMPVSAFEQSENIAIALADLVLFFRFITTTLCICLESPVL